MQWTLPQQCASACRAGRHSRTSSQSTLQMSACLIGKVAPASSSVSAALCRSNLLTSASCLKYSSRCIGRSRRSKRSRCITQLNLIPRQASVPKPLAFNPNHQITNSSPHTQNPKILNHKPPNPNPELLEPTPNPFPQTPGTLPASTCAGIKSRSQSQIRAADGQITYSCI